MHVGREGRALRHHAWLVAAPARFRRARPDAFRSALSVRVDSSRADLRSRFQPGFHVHDAVLVADGDTIFALRLPRYQQTSWRLTASIYLVYTSWVTEDIRDLLAAATGFQWDEGNAPKVRARHDVDPGECEQAFFVEPFLVAEDPKHSATEPRLQALGRTLAGRDLFLVFTLRGTLIRVIAARDMNRKERRQYGEAEAGAERDPEV